MRRKIPPLQTLVCFDAAARHESYTRAAQELATPRSLMEAMRDLVDGATADALMAEALAQGTTRDTTAR